MAGMCVRCSRVLEKGTITRDESLRTLNSVPEPGYADLYAINAINGCECNLCGICLYCFVSVTVETWKPLLIGCTPWRLIEIPKA